MKVGKLRSRSGSTGSEICKICSIAQLPRKSKEPLQMRWDYGIWPLRLILSFNREVIITRNSLIEVPAKHKITKWSSSRTLFERRKIRPKTLKAAPDNISRVKIRIYSQLKLPPSIASTSTLHSNNNKRRITSSCFKTLRMPGLHFKELLQSSNSNILWTKSLKLCIHWSFRKIWFLGMVLEAIIFVLRDPTIIASSPAMSLSLTTYSSSNSTKLYLRIILIMLWTLAPQ